MTAIQFDDYNAAFQAVIRAVEGISGTVVGKESGELYTFAVPTCVPDLIQIEDNLRAAGIEGAVQVFQSASSSGNEPTRSPGHTLAISSRSSSRDLNRRRGDVLCRDRRSR